MRGDFKNDFDLHHFPADRQSLAIRFFNARADSDRLLYVQDRRTSIGENGPLAVAAADNPSVGAAFAGVPSDAPAIGRAGDRAVGGLVAPDAFRNLTQWEPLRTSQRRDILVAESSLGDPVLVGLERVRVLSGFNLTIELRRLVLATLAKTLLPLGLMALIMYASLFFPIALVKEKVTVAITAALSGAVLLSAINAQLGNIGYVIAVEYLFYAFFTLCLLCIVSVLSVEQLRVAGRKEMAVTAEWSTRVLFLLAVAGMTAAAWLVGSRW
jgi:branched-chain amino acid transport system substrate-binding protein